MGTIKGVSALQEWARRILANEPYAMKVQVENMSQSWKNGMAFCAIIHHFRPDLIDFDSLDPMNVYGNNLLAFTVAEEQLGIPTLLDAADMNVLPRPDRLSIITYVAQLYEYFKSQSPVTSPKTPMIGSQKTTEDKPVSLSAAKRYDYGSLRNLNRLKPVGITSDIVDSSASQTQHLCVECGQQVYIMERLVIDDLTYHRVCFRCVRCKKQLKSGLYRDYYNLPGDQLLSDLSNVQHRYYECLSHEREHLAYDSIVKQKKQKTSDNGEETHHISPAIVVTEDKKSLYPVISAETNPKLRDLQIDVDHKLEDNSVPKKSPIPPPVPAKPKFRLSDLAESHSQTESIQEATSDPRSVQEATSDPRSVQEAASDPPVYDMTLSMTLSNTGDSLSGTEKEIPPVITVATEFLQENPSQFVEKSLHITESNSTPDNPVPLPRRHNRSGATTPLRRENSADQLEKTAQKQFDSLERKLLTSPVQSRLDLYSYSTIEGNDKPVPAPRSRKSLALGSSEKLIKKTDALHYPTDLNPFGEEEEETNMKQNTTHSSLNPFGSDTDENEAEIPTVTRGSTSSSQHRISMPVLHSHKVNLRESTKQMDRNSMRSSTQSLTRRSKRPAPLPPPPSVTPPEPPISTGTLTRPSVVPPPPPVDSGKIGKKKGPAPPRPLPPRRCIQIEKILSAEQRQIEFDKLDKLQLELVANSKSTEDKLRKIDEDKWSEHPDLLSDWFKLINERNRLQRKEADLVYMERVDMLNNLHADIEFEVRKSMDRPESERDEESLKREKELLARLVEVVNEKSTLVEGQADEEYRQSLEERNIGDLEKKIKKGLKLRSKDKSKNVQIKKEENADTTVDSTKTEAKKKKFKIHLGTKKEKSGEKKHISETSKEI